MPDKPVASRLADLLKTLKPKTKQPVSAKVLNTWIAQAEGRLGEDARGGRLGWLIASSVAIAAVQRAIDTDGRHLFLLKGGTLLQHRLNATARATKDVDGLIRGDLDEFFVALEEALAEPWGPVALRRSEVETVDVPTKIIKPRRFDIVLELRGVTWRRVQFEVSPDEAGIGDEQEAIEPPPLSGFGLPDPDALVGIAMRFQIAQNSTRSPTHTNHRTRSTTALATSSTCSCYVTLQPRPGARHCLRSAMLASPCSRLEQVKPTSWGDRPGRGRRWSWLTITGATISTGPRIPAVSTWLSMTPSPRRMRGSANSLDRGGRHPLDAKYRTTCRILFVSEATARLHPGWAGRPSAQRRRPRRVAR